MKERKVKIKGIPYDAALLFTGTSEERKRICSLEKKQMMRIKAIITSPDFHVLSYNLLRAGKPTALAVGVSRHVLHDGSLPFYKGRRRSAAYVYL